jgi:hypothetical protein
MGSSWSKHLKVLQTALANFRKGFSGDHELKIKLAKVLRFCKLKWPTFNAGWPAEGTLDLAIITHTRPLCPPRDLSPIQGTPIGKIKYWT